MDSPAERVALMTCCPRDHLTSSRPTHHRAVRQRGNWERETTARICDFVIAKAGRLELGVTDMSVIRSLGRPEESARPSTGFGASGTGS